TRASRPPPHRAAFATIEYVHSAGGQELFTRGRDRAGCLLDHRVTPRDDGDRVGPRLALPGRSGGGQDVGHGALLACRAPGEDRPTSPTVRSPPSGPARPVGRALPVRAQGPPPSRSQPEGLRPRACEGLDAGSAADRHGTPAAGGPRHTDPRAPSGNASG